MTLKGKKKKLIILGILLAAMVMLLFFPGEEKEGREESIEQRENEADVSEEDLQYMKQYAWYTDDGAERYWLLISEKESYEGDESSFALTYTEHTDVEIEGKELTGRFTDTIYYEDITVDRGRIAISNGDGKAIDGIYKTNPQERTLTLYLISEEGSEDMAVFHGVPFDELIYPTV